MFETETTEILMCVVVRHSHWKDVKIAIIFFSSFHWIVLLEASVVWSACFISTIYLFTTNNIYNEWMMMTMCRYFQFLECNFIFSHFNHNYLYRLNRFAIIWSHSVHLISSCDQTEHRFRMDYMKVKCRHPFPFKRNNKFGTAWI